MKDRINSLHDSFLKAIKAYKYKNIYQGVFPVKCNQQKNVLEKIIEFGSQWNFGFQEVQGQLIVLIYFLLLNQNSIGYQTLLSFLGHFSVDYILSLIHI